MSSAFENLLGEISPESPTGDERIYSRRLRESLTSLRKPEIPNGDSDTSYRRAADWDSIVDISTTALTEQTKDIRIVCHLVEAWTQIRGFDGLADGLALLTEFTSICWERCNPSIDDGDLEVRTAPIENMLDDAQRGTCFPMTIRQLPLLGTSADPCDYLDYDRLQKSSDSADRQQLARFVANTNPNQLEETAKAINRCQENLAHLKSALDEKLADQAPGLTYLRSAIEDCRRVMLTHLPKELPSDPETGTEAFGSEVPSTENTTGAGENLAATQTNPSSLNSRDGAYQQLTRAAEYLQRTEPHSPIPYLIHRAVKLGQLPFPELVQQLVREEGILNELRREFGIMEGTVD